MSIVRPPDDIAMKALSAFDPSEVSPIGSHEPSLAERLNHGCFCVTLDRDALAIEFDREVGVKGFAGALAESHPLLFSNSPVFVPAEAMDQMARVVTAVEAATKLSGYREAALSWAEPVARRDFGPVGALMGYDFHLTDDGPRLIEVNTNAGGAFLIAPLARSQRACCAPALWGADLPDFADNMAAMFAEEWACQRGGGRRGSIAIIDDDPGAQNLLPEFRLAQSLLRTHGMETFIADPRDLTRSDTGLSLEGKPIDLIYNRLTDFAFEHADHAVLREAYELGSVVVTPNPHNYALFADKRNLTLICDQNRLSAWGLGVGHLAALRKASLPTLRVASANAEMLWKERRRWFFKPARGYASKAAYRGEKLTRRVWEEILSGDYVAQSYARPGSRYVRIEGSPAELKVDVRLYTYNGLVLLTAARLYRGQTTNMRTPGGGFAPVLIVPGPQVASETPTN